MSSTDDLPARARKLGRVFTADMSVAAAAAHVCERGWKGPGVRVWAWPNGTLVVCRVGSPGDAMLLRMSMAQLFATYARHGVDRRLGGGEGPKLPDVVDELAWARAHA